MTPAGSPRISHPTCPAAASRPTWATDAWSTVTATSGRATRVTAEPTPLTVVAVQKRQNDENDAVVRPVITVVMTPSFPVGSGP